MESDGLNAVHIWQIVGICTTILVVIVGLAAAYVKLFVSNEIGKVRGKIDLLTAECEHIKERLDSVEEMCPLDTNCPFHNKKGVK